MADAVRVRGLRELERAFDRADRTVRNDMRDALAEAAAPVRRDAQSLAASQIRNVDAGDPWASMRIGSAAPSRTSHLWSVESRAVPVSAGAGRTWRTC